MKKNYFRVVSFVLIITVMLNNQSLATLAFENSDNVADIIGTYDCNIETEMSFENTSEVFSENESESFSENESESFGENELTESDSEILASEQSLDCSLDEDDNDEIFVQADGNNENTLLIYDLDTLLDYLNNSNTKYKGIRYIELKNDINFNSSENSLINVWKNVHIYGFEGNGHTISNIYINDQTNSSNYYYSMFSCEYISNLKVNNIHINAEYEGTRKYLYIIDGFAADGKHDVDNVSISGNFVVNAPSKSKQCDVFVYPMGVCSNFKNCLFDANLTINTSNEASYSRKNKVYCSGIGTGDVFSNCTNSGSIMVTGGEAYVYGIAGTANEITNCFTADDSLFVADANYYSSISGIAGECTQKIDGCINRATICGKSVSGILETATGCDVRNCENYGELKPSSSANGIVGSANNAYIYCCYNFGTISNDSKNSDCSGIVGSCSNASKIIFCNNEGDINGSHSSGIVGKLSEGCVVESCANKGNIGGYIASGIVYEMCNIKSTSTIDMAPRILVCTNFGTIDGNISSGFVYNAYVGVLDKCENRGEIGEINSSQSAGMISRVIGRSSDAENSVVISRCANSADVWSKGDAAGIGQIIRNASLFCCFNSGDITSEGGKVGGLFSEMRDNTLVSNSFNCGSITGTKNSFVGGISGYINGANISITNFYTIGEVNGDSECGMLAGYYSGNPISTQYVYYLNNKIKQFGTGNNVNAKACTEAELKTKKNFVGFNFDNIWSMGSEDGTYFFPVLNGVGHIGSKDIVIVDDPKWKDRWEIIDDEILILMGDGDLPDIKDNSQAPWWSYLGIKKVIIREGVTKVGINNLRYLPYVTTLCLPNSIQSFPQDEIKKLNKLLRIEYNGTKDEWSKIYPEIYFSELINISFIDGKMIGNYKYVAADGLNYELQHKYDWDDAWFFEDSSTYNHNLARLSLGVEMAAFSSEAWFYGNTLDLYDLELKKGTVVDGNARAINIVQLMSQMGFNYSCDSIDYPNWDAQNINTIGFAIGDKQVTYDNNDASIVLCAIRGAGYGYEWGGNFNVGNNVEHEGFLLAEQQVYEALNKYINSNKNRLGNNVKIWIVGYSRGAAVANLLAADLDVLSKTSSLISKDNIFAYTFETPRCTKSTHVDENIYNNIFNIVNQNDFVPKVAPSLWGYKRYGQTYYIPSVESNGADYDSLEYKMKNAYYSNMGESYDSKRIDENTDFNIQQPFVYESIISAIAYELDQDYYVKELQKSVTYLVSMSEFATGIYNDTQSDIKNIIYEILSNMSLGAQVSVLNKIYKNFDSILLGGASFSAAYIYDCVSGGKLKEMINDIFALDKISVAHYPELCLAWMDTLDEDTLTSDKSTVEHIIQNAMDIVIYDSNGNAVVEINSGKLIKQIEYISVLVDDNNKISIVTPKDEALTIKVGGISNDNLSYVAKTYFDDYGAPSQIKNYDLSIDSSIYTVKMTDGGVLLYDENNDLIESSNEYDSETIETIEISTITSCDSGIAIGSGKYFIGDIVDLIAVPYRNEDDFEGWYINDELVSEELQYSMIAMKNTCIEARFNEINNELWIKGIDPNGYSYTGKVIKPIVQVYDGMTLLRQDYDYTITYKNNINVNDATDLLRAPVITVKGKGNYEGIETSTFKIVPINISGEEFYADDIVLAVSNKDKKPKPIFIWNGKAVPAAGYKYAYYVADELGNPTGDALAAIKDAGDYVIVITGNGNFTGTRNVKVTVTNDYKDASKLTVTKIPNQQYTGGVIKPELTVKDGKNPLVLGEDYTVTYKNNKAVGTATAIITGKGNYLGTKRVTFNITGTPITKATIDNIPKTVVYKGSDYTIEDFDNVKLYIKATAKTNQIDLTEGKDYTVSYLNNKKAGTATAIFTGKNGYTGVLKKTFKITQFKSVDDTEGRISVNVAPSVEYSKGGAKPEVEVTFKNSDGTTDTLVEKTDYTLAYTNNAAVNDGSNEKKLPTVKVTLKGNYNGTASANYVIKAKDISKTIATAPDKVYANKPGAYKSVVTVTDLDGKKLGANKDYLSTVTYRIKGADEDLDPKAIVDADTIIVATITAKDVGNYTGTTTCEYRISKAAISAANIKFESQIYTGKAIELDPEKDIISAKIGAKTDLVYGNDYVIDSYTNNTKKGTASVMIRGVGNYGGTKKVTFVIKAKKFIWWWKQ